MDSVDFIILLFWAMLVSLGFAALFNTPRRAMWVVALLGALGFGIKTTLITDFIPGQVVLASLAGASAVGILGTYFAHRVHTPPIVFTIPAVINMIPGKFGYEFMIGLLHTVTYGKEKSGSFDFFMEVFNNGLKTGFILMALAFGVIFPILMFNTRSVKNRDLNKIVKDNLHLRKSHKSKKEH